MSVDIRNIGITNRLITYFAKILSWDIDTDDFDDIEDIYYDFEAEDLGLKEEAFAKIKSLRQLQPLVDGQKWGIFSVEFDGKKFEVTALRKVLSGLIPKKRNSADHAVWDQKDLLFICFWGEDNNRTIGIAHFEDKEVGLPQLKMIYCAPAIEDPIQIQNFEIRLKHLTWPVDVYDTQKWHDDWSKAFTTGYRQTIHDASTLTIQLAVEARGIRNRILETLEVETENGYVHQLYGKFKDTLIHDMTETQFADMYAQTVVYGLFSARCMDETQDDFSAAEAVECIPNTNPFLKSLMKECLGSQNNSKLSYDELEIGNVVDLLLHTKTDAIIQDFNRQTGGGREDPVIHFYEEFLTAYDKDQKVQRGVYYTPQPVVNFIVRAVDTIIKTEFGLEDGLASTETKSIKYLRDSMRRKDGRYRTKVEDTKGVPAIQILDPSTGTGTFLSQIILQIYEDFKGKNKELSDDELKRAWNEYVPEHLLPRLNGFELMMAPYAVAHMKLAMVLKDTGYDFESGERLNVYLTNTLEEPGNSDGQMTLFEDPLASESIAANVVKKNEGIDVVIGNPPYAAASSNKGTYILDLMEEYKKEPGGQIKLQEKNPKWLNDDYVKFIRFSENILADSRQGILAFINPHGFIDNPTFRGMRWHLLRTFDEIYILDLHGNSNRKEKCPDGSKDENVFDIQQGVSINIFVKKTNSVSSLAKVHHADLWGIRDLKYKYLSEHDIDGVSFTTVTISEPEYNFTPTNVALKEKYSSGFSVDALFSKYSVGVVTAKDKILIGSTREEVLAQVSEYYGIVADKEKVYPIYYRPFDQKYIYYDTKLLERSRENIMTSFFQDNIGLITARSNRGEDCTQFLVTDMMSEAKCGERTTQSALFPLYLYSHQMGEHKKDLNLNRKIIEKIESSLGLKLRYKNNESGGFDPEDLLVYIYAVLYLEEYREKYKQFINADFPRIPYPTEKSVFYSLVTYGKKLINLHLMHKPKTSMYDDKRLVGKIIEKVTYKNSMVYINKIDSFENIEADIWNYTMCGYQPMQKWLKDRRGCDLTEAEVINFRQMQEAIEETIEIMDEMKRDPIASKIIP